MFLLQLFTFLIVHGTFVHNFEDFHSLYSNFESFSNQFDLNLLSKLCTSVMHLSTKALTTERDAT